MKKASKVLVLLLVAVLTIGILCGCGAFTKNTEKYRATAAIQVGAETITIGKLIDTFNNYYNSYYSYIQQGYITLDSILDIAIESLYTQYMKLDAYKTTSGVPTFSHANDLGLANANYLDEDELAYAVRYVKYLLFNTLDGIVEDYIEADGYELEDAETEDTSRDFVEYDDFGDSKTYSEYLFNQNLHNDEMDEYVEKYYPNLDGTSLSVDEYVFASEQAGQAKVDELNERLEDDEEITFDQLKSWQELALAQYKKNVMYNYKYSVEKLVANQTEEMIISLIIAKYNYSIYNVIDTTDLQETLATLQSEYEKLKSNQTAKFQINKDFVSYIEDLSDTSYIFDVPEEFADSYIFVKNILIPFSTEQVTILSNLQKQLGSTDNDLYIAKRNEFAAQIVAEDYLSEKDDDGNYAKVENLFILQDGKVVVNPDGALGQYLKADGTVAVMEGKDETQTIVELMKQYNTDVAQHSTIYDYVVRVGEVPASYTSPWVDEFVDAANEAYELANGANGGTYSIGISSYGVHIVYFSAKVTAQTIDFQNNLFVTDSAEYRMFTTYFESQSSILSDANLESLKENYYNGKIIKLSGFDKFLKNNGLSFDFAQSISLDDEEE